MAAADALAYSFENDTDGFGPNPNGITITQDTIGATEGTHSMKVAVVGGATFVGALTPNIDPAILGNPPGVDHVLLDLTMPSEFPAPPNVGFGVIGVSIFASSQPDFPGGQLNGLQVQFFDSDADFNNEVHLDGLAVGLHQDLRIELTHATNPLTFDERQSFNEIFGDGPNQLIPTSFEFYFNKTGGAAFPLTLYIDNVRFGMSVPGDYNGNGVVDAADYTVWRDTLGSTEDLRANGDDTGASMGVIDQADYVFWKSQFGVPVGGGSLSVGGVPEPTGFELLMLIGVSCYSTRARRWTR